MKTVLPQVSLGELLRLERRPVKIEPDEQYQEIGIYCFGRGIFPKAPRSGLEVGDKNLFLMKEGDFILQVTFAWEGAVAIVSSVEDGMYGSTRYPTFRVDTSRCVSQYLLNYFRTKEGLQQLIKICPGSAGRNRVLSIKRIPEVLVPLPPLTEQRRVVARIEELTAQIQEARGLRQQSHKETAALWMAGASRVFDHASETHPLRELSEMVATVGGGTPSTSNPQYWQGPTPWISPKDMKARELHDAIDHISEHAIKETAAKLIQPGAVLVVVRGMILAHTFPNAVLRVPAAINQDMKALIPAAELLPEYLCTMLWAYNARILELVEKSTHDTRKLQTEKLLSTKICVPPLAEQRRIVAELDAMEAKVDSLTRLQTETTAELDALLPAILDRAFKGELV